VLLVIARLPAIRTNTNNGEKDHATSKKQDAVLLVIAWLPAISPNTNNGKNYMY
jgi:hypothetical protein